MTLLHTRSISQGRQGMHLTLPTLTYTTVSQYTQKATLVPDYLLYSLRFEFVGLRVCRLRRCGAYRARTAQPSTAPDAGHACGRAPCVAAPAVDVLLTGSSQSAVTWCRRCRTSPSVLGQYHRRARTLLQISPPKSTIDALVLAVVACTGRLAGARQCVHHRVCSVVCIGGRRLLV